MRHDDTAQRARQITGSENTKSLNLTQPVGHIGREEEIANYRSEKDENDEIVEFEGATQCRQGKRFEVLPVQPARLCVLHRIPSDTRVKNGKRFCHLM
ncbi:hypothetical protein SRABI106_03141 [Rahnella aquatilis]|nr:hypothetical protein SRABI106_03141 [Rahnella aquatilis]